MPDRQRDVAPRCAHFGVCGGCSLQHVSYPEQLRQKAARVTTLVRAAVPGAPAAKPMIAATPLDDPWGFRQKVHFVFGTGHDGRLVMGHYARGSRRIIPVRECPVHDERGNALAFALRDGYARAGIPAVPAGTLKSVAIRVAASTPETMTTLVVTDGSDRRLRAATRTLLDRTPGRSLETSSFHLNVHPRGGAFIFGDETRRIAGSARLREAIAGVSFLISPTAFFQTNVRAADILVRLVTEAVPSGARVLDLYAGAGLFALPLAKSGCTVVAVEENRIAVEDGEASRALNRVTPGQCRFIARPAEQALAGLRRSARGRADAFDAVVLDPPRDGCSSTVVDAVFGVVAPELAVYVSCHPEALARDLAAMARHRYRIESLQPVDMFPHTEHTETVAVLRRR